MRIETDSIGSRELPDDVYYGVQTLRAIENFAVSGVPCSAYPSYINAVAAVKKAAALANTEIGVLPAEKADVIVKACDDILSGKLHCEFPVDVIQGGGGTSVNMNANEVIANRASEILCGWKSYDEINPNDHVNLGQSTNDVIPSAIKIAVYLELGTLLTEVETLSAALRKKQMEFAEIPKIARTCLQDALPVTLGQEFGGYATLIERQAEKIRHAQKECLSLSIGATAVGTGLCAFEGYSEAVFRHLRSIFSVNFTQASDLFDGLQNADVYITVSSSLKSLACSISKIAKDFRILSSGPRAGISEITLPAVQPGSSMMPGKTNPVLPELMIQICYQVCGNDTAVTMASESGELDLNVWEPVFIKNIFESIRLLRNGIKQFTERCVREVLANEEVCRENAESSLALSTIIASIYDYETGSKVAKKAFDEKKTIKAAAIELGLLSDEQAREVLDTLLLTDKKKSNELLLKIWREKQ